MWIEVEKTQKALAAFRKLLYSTFQKELLLNGLNVRILLGKIVFNGNIFPCGTQDGVGASFRDSDQPGREGPVIAETFQALKKIEANPLKDIANVFWLGTQLAGDRVDKSLIAMDQLRPGVLISLETGVDQFSVGRRHLGSILTAIRPLHAEKSRDSGSLTIWLEAGQELHLGATTFGRFVEGMTQ